MKKLFLMLIIFVSMLTPNEANNSCDVVKCIDKRYLNDAEYIKDVTLYTYDGWSQNLGKAMWHRCTEQKEDMILCIIS